MISLLITLKSVIRANIYMEAYRSGHNGPDSKSGNLNGFVGSNPTASALVKWLKTLYICGFELFLFVKQQSMISILQRMGDYIIVLFPC